MVDYKEILRMRHMGYSQRQIASSTRSSHHTVKEVLELAETNSISWTLDESINNADLEMIFYPKLAERYGDKRLELACEQILKYSAVPSLRNIAMLLKNNSTNPSKTSVASR